MSLEKSKKPLGFWMLTALLIGNVVGSGIFLLPSALAKLGSISLFGWVVTSIGAICAALVFAELSRAIPTSGGLYVFSRKAFGDFVGFQNAYLYWIALWGGNAAMIVAATSYLSFFWPALNNNGELSFLVGTMILWSLTLVNIRGVKDGAIVQSITVILKLIPFAAIIGFGLFHLQPHYLTSSFNVSGHGAVRAIFLASTLTLWAFLGIETVTVPGGVVDNPAKNIPRSVVFGTITVAIIYLVTTTIVMCVLPMTLLANSASPLTDVATVIFGHLGGVLIGVGAVVTIIGAVNGFVLVTGQMAQAAARDGFFPKIFLRVSKNDVPVAGLIISSICTNLLLAISFNQSLVNQFMFIILLATLANIIPYFMACLAFLRLMKKGEINFSRKKAILYSIIATAALIFVLGAIIGSGLKILIITAAILLASYPLYRWMQSNKLG
jgi:APA family basic amino acid/polyamine antiporter